METLGSENNEISRATPEKIDATKAFIKGGIKLIYHFNGSYNLNYLLINGSINFFYLIYLIEDSKIHQIIPNNNYNIEEYLHHLELTIKRFGIEYLSNIINEGNFVVEEFLLLNTQ